MAVEVVAGTEGAPTAVVVPQSPNAEYVSQLAPSRHTAMTSLREKRQKLLDESFIDLKVPRWEDPEVYVRYRPIDSALMEASIDRRQRQFPKGGAQIWINADVLAQSCVGVYAVLDGDPEIKYSLRPGDEHGTMTVFDPDLRDNLGLTHDQAPDAPSICRKLYITDGDLIAAAYALMDFSGIQAEKVNEDFTTP